MDLVVAFADYGICTGKIDALLSSMIGLDDVGRVTGYMFRETISNSGTCPKNV